VAVGSRDPYEVLGVPRDASQEEIRNAYRRIARQNHPDVNKEEGASERFTEAGEAHDILRDPEKRAEYDRMSSGGFRGGAPGGAGGGFRDVDFDFGGGGGGGFGDIFENLFRGRGGGGGGGFSMRGGDAEATIELSLEEAARGGRRHITLGDGRDFDVDIPAGVTDGQRIRLAGEGQPGAGGGPAGDLFLRVRLRRHPRFHVEGRDLHADLPVAPWEAALGASVEVETLDGTARVTVPAGSSSGRRLRLRGEGMPGPRGAQGDLYLTVMIHVPKQLSSRERELFEQLADASDFDPRRRERRRATTA
jgi:curved DNA-binding protein